MPTLPLSSRARKPLRRSSGRIWRIGLLPSEVAHVLQFGLAIGRTHHEPLADAAPGVAHHQRDAAQQRADAGDLAAVADQLVTTVELLAAQVEDIRAGLAADRVKPHVPRVDQQLTDRLGQLRQAQALLLEGHLAGQQVLAAGDALGMQRAAGGAGDQQGLAVQADGGALDGAAFRIELKRRLAEGIGELGVMVFWLFG